MSALSQLQGLLRDFFQLDLADLDFGLYRLLRLKRQEVEAFLTEQLPRRVEEAFRSMAGEERASLEEEVSSLASRIRKDVAGDALLDSGEVSPEYCYGLHVGRMETWVNDQDNRTYRAVKGRNREGQHVLVLWRDMEGLDPAVERRFLEAKLEADGPFDEMLINGDTATPGIKSLDALFKRLLEEGE